MFHSTSKLLPFLGPNNQNIIVSPSPKQHKHYDYDNISALNRNSGSFSSEKVTPVSFINNPSKKKTESCLVLYQQQKSDTYNDNDDVQNDKERKLLEVLLSKEELEELESDDKKETAIDPAKVSSQAMITSIKFYKSYISPLLPPACRFVPTCSQYGIAAIEKFGPVKGGVLTAWRLMRCTPIGGKGYDPPQWPPVRYDYSSY